MCGGWIGPRGPVYPSRGMDIFAIQEGFRGFEGLTGRPLRRPVSLRHLHGRLERGKEGLKGIDIALHLLGRRAARQTRRQQRLEGPDKPVKRRAVGKRPHAFCHAGEDAADFPPQHREGLTGDCVAARLILRDAIDLDLANRRLQPLGHPSAGAGPDTRQLRVADRRRYTAYAGCFLTLNAAAVKPEMA